MKTKLIPAINADGFEEIAQKIKTLEPLAQEFGLGWVHVDVADGTFTKNTIWHEPKDLVGFDTIFDLELHLMIADIDRRIDEWLFGPVKRVIFHIEAGHDPKLVIQKCVSSGIEVGLAVSPETSWIKTKPYWDTLNLVQILGVMPGKAGQKMGEDIVDKVKGLRGACPECIIEIDGGVTLENAKELAEAGADYIVAASAIFGAKDLKKAILDLQKAIK